MILVDAQAPHVPPIATSDWPAVGGRLGPELDDFVVEEIPLYAPSGQGEHWYVLLRKRGMTTQDLVANVARAANVAPREVGMAGLKDKHAVTVQWLSVGVRGAREPADWQLPSGIDLVDVKRHENKLRTGHLAGNRFKVRLVDTEPDAVVRARGIFAYIEQNGLVNYFGVQRFGRGGGNLRQAVAWLRRPRARADRFHRKLYPSVLQAEVFNRYATLRLAEHEELFAGEIVRLEGRAAVFRVIDPASELDRLRQRDIHRTGPMFGPKMLEATERAGALEQEALASLGLRGEEVTRLGKFAPGTRRDLLVWPSEMALEASGQTGLRLEFTLPSGSYATQLVRELTRTPFFAETAAG